VKNKTKKHEEWLLFAPQANLQQESEGLVNAKLNLQNK